MFKKISLIRLLYFCLGLGIILTLLTHPPIVGADTLSYINFDSNRPPLYPIFLWLFKWCGGHQFEAVTWVKTILYGLTLYYARTWLLENLGLSDFLIFFNFMFYYTHHF